MDKDMNIIYRNARKEDSVRLAELDNIASGGAVEYLFRDLIPNMSPVEIVATNYSEDRYPHSYRSAIVAEYDGHIVAMSLSFPGSFHKITDEMTNFFPAERIEHFKYFFSAPVEDCYLLDALCVDKQYRRKGIGEKLLELTELKAKSDGYATLSLLVWRDNVKALKFYDKNGFKKISSVELHYHELMPHKGGCLLMKKNI